MGGQAGEEEEIRWGPNVECRPVAAAGEVEGLAGLSLAMGVWSWDRSGRVEDRIGWGWDGMWRGAGAGAG